MIGEATGELPVILHQFGLLEGSASGMAVSGLRYRDHPFRVGAFPDRDRAWDHGFRHCFAVRAGVGMVRLSHSGSSFAFCGCPLSDLDSSAVDAGSLANLTAILCI